MQVILNKGERVHVRWRYSTRDKQVRIPGSLIKAQERMIYGLNIPLEEKRELLNAIVRETTTKQELTTCFVTNSETEENLAEVTVIRWHKDLDNKPLARKMTFEMAIKGFGKEDKRILWEEYLKSVRLPKKAEIKAIKSFFIEL